MPPPSGNAPPAVSVSEVLSAAHPRALLFEDALPPDDTAALLSLAKQRVDECESEFSSSFILRDKADLEHSAVANLARVAASAARLPVEWCEAISVTRYKEGQCYDWHYDDAAIPTRKATFLAYLNTVEYGGETAFPYVGGAGCTPATHPREDLPPVSCMFPEDLPGSFLGVLPVEGLALLFYSKDEKGKHDPYALHGSVPVRCPLSGTGREAGEKWIAQVWLHDRDVPGLTGVFSSQAAGPSSSQMGEAASLGQDKQGRDLAGGGGGDESAACMALMLREVVVEVLRYLPLEDIASGAAVCSVWKDASLDPDLWENLAHHRWGRWLQPAPGGAGWRELYKVAHNFAPSELYGWCEDNVTAGGLPYKMELKSIDFSRGGGGEELGACVRGGGREGGTFTCRGAWQYADPPPRTRIVGAVGRSERSAARKGKGPARRYQGSPQRHPRLPPSLLTHIFSREHLVDRPVFFREVEKLPGSGPVDVPVAYSGYVVGPALLGTFLPEGYPTHALGLDGPEQAFGCFVVWSGEFEAARPGAGAGAAGGERGGRGGASPAPPPDRPELEVGQVLRGSAIANLSIYGERRGSQGPAAGGLGPGGAMPAPGYGISRGPPALHQASVVVRLVEDADPEEEPARGPGGGMVVLTAVVVIELMSPVEGLGDTATAAGISLGRMFPVRVLARINVCADGRVFPAEGGIAGGWVQQWGFMGDLNASSLQSGAMGRHQRSMSIDVDHGSSEAQSSSHSAELDRFSALSLGPNRVGRGGQGSVGVISPPSSSQYEWRSRSGDGSESTAVANSADYEVRRGDGGRSSSVDHLAVDSGCEAQAAQEAPTSLGGKQGGAQCSASHGDSPSVSMRPAVPPTPPSTSNPPVLFLSASVYGRLCDGVLVGMFTHNTLGRGTFSVTLDAMRWA